MIIAAADGSALGNPGPAGWGWYVDDTCWASGGWAHGTNNMGELMAVLDLLRQSAHIDDELHIICDSRYVIDSITKWMPNWKRNGWVKKDRKPVLNLELMKALDEAMQGRRVTFEWVKGHAGHHLNEEADRLANAAATAFRDGREPASGPGFRDDPSGLLNQRGDDDPSGLLNQRGDDEALVEEGRSPVTKPSTLDEPDLFSDLEPEVSEEEQVIALQRSLLTDEVRSDPASVAALLHPQWQEVSASGVLRGREEVLDRVGPLSSPVALDVLTASRVAPGLILLLWRAASDDGSRLCSSLWQRVGGRWQQRFHQGTSEA